MTVMSAAVLLFFVMDPLGNVPLFLTALRRVAPDRHRRVILRELVIALVVLVGFLFLGKGLLALLKVSAEALTAAGGVILLLIALRMIFPSSDHSLREDVQDEPFIVPLAVPYTAGPSALATVMLMASRDPAKMGMWAAAVTVTMAITTVVLLAGTRLHRWLGDHAMHAIERLMGLILTAIAVEMLLAGIREFVKGL